MIDFTHAIESLAAAEDAPPAERIMHWRRILMGLATTSFEEGYAAALADAPRHAQLRRTNGDVPVPPYRQAPVVHQMAPVVPPGPAPVFPPGVRPLNDDRPAIVANGNGGGPIENPSQG